MKERPILFSAPMVKAILEGRKTQTRRIMKPQPDHLQVYDFKGKRLYDGENRLWCWNGHVSEDLQSIEAFLRDRCPYGVSGDHLWVRETWTLIPNDMRGRDLSVAYRAGGESKVHKGEDVYGAPGSALVHMTIGCDLAEYDNGNWGVWRPSIHMPRLASRLTLEVVSVKVERLQDITEDDAKAEGVHQRARKPGLKPKDGPCSECGRSYHEHPGGSCYRTGFHNLTFKGAYAHLWNEINGKGSWDANPWVWVVEFRPLAALQATEQSATSAHVNPDSNSPTSDRETKEEGGKGEIK